MGAVRMQERCWVRFERLTEGADRTSNSGIVNELATNAVKYGALSNAAGSILIGWTMETAPAGKRLLLSWTEKGGPPVTPPAHKGFGSRVLERGLAHELEGAVHLDCRPDGLVCTMDIPLPRGARDG
jgi:two-component sensor histidine kinase